MHPLLIFPVHNLKNRISRPFDFQHLTHTDRNQFPALEQASENDLVAEFWAVRASQAPRRDLTGIKAEDLHLYNFSTENLASESRSTSSLAFRSPPGSPEPYEGQLPSGFAEESNGQSLRLIRSVESFSRPGINPRAHRHTQSANPPPRVSSRVALAPIHDVPEEAVDNHEPFHVMRSQSNRQSGMWDYFIPLSPTSSRGQLPPMAEESEYVAHAFTTPDDSAIHPMTPPFSPGLDHVAEEPERFISPRPAPRPPVRSPRSPKSPAFESFAFSNQRSPISRSHNRKSSYTSPKSSNQRSSMIRPMSQMSDTLGSPGVTRRTSVRRASSSRRKSNTWRVIEESWEDDVDYIYDNALEADCDFDWDCTSDGGSFEDRDRTPEQQDHQPSSATRSHHTRASSSIAEEEPTLQTRFFPGPFAPSLRVPSANNVPELESRSAASASTADTGVRTPSDFFGAPSQDEEGFHLNPSLLVPHDYKDQVSREDMYDDLLADYEGFDRHFPLLDASRSVASSTRSSHVRSSKRSSYDSSLMSSGQASGSWTSGIRRSASSSGSLPELVHSRRARRDFNMMVDHLSEQVASFSAFGEDDTEENEDDTTPPAHASPDRTFFTADDEPQQDDDVRASIELEVRASLELARQGSTRSSRAPAHYHKYASSDGAAKLLASPLPPTPEPRPSRSHIRATSSITALRGKRDQYLSLFPTPPTHSPLPSPSTASESAFNRF